MERPNPYQPENAGIKKPDPQQAPPEGGNGSPAIPPTLQERAKPPPEKSALNRAVERTRDPYERNGWIFLPLGEAGWSSRGNLDQQPEQSPQDGGSKSPERKRRTRLIYNPKKETFEEYKKRFDETWAQRKIEDAQRRQDNPDEQKEKRRKYHREYTRRWRQARREQREAALTQRDQEHHDAIQIFPSPPKP
jgi:hypothetical protein